MAVTASVNLKGYRCEKQIGQGGMADVFLGMQLSLKRPVAIKFLSDSFLEHPEARALFEQESLIIAQLAHPNIVNVIDRGIIDDRPYFIMEFINGCELDKYVEQQKPSLQDAIELITQICKGVAYAHQNGIIHRDLKPSNIFIDENKVPKILDFGIALLYTGSQGATQSKSVVGSRNYMSPEQLRTPHKVDHLTDIYALGVIMYQLFTGQLPSKGKLTAPASLNAEIPAELSKLILLCLSPDKSLRPQSAEMLRDTLLKSTRGRHLSREISERAQELTTKLKDKFELLDVIAEKKFSSLYLFQNTESSQLLALKKILGGQGGNKEAAILMQHKHPNIGQIIGRSNNEKLLMVISEYLPGGPLLNHLNRPFELETFVEVAIDLTNAMVFAHRLQVVHGNIHPNNVLYTADGQVKLVDFGLHTPDHDLDELHQQYRGYSKEASSKRRDIFQMGALFHHMLLCKPPVIVKGRWKRSSALAQLPPEYLKLLENMLTDNMDRRYTSFEEVALKLDELQKTAASDSAAIKEKNKPTSSDTAFEPMRFKKGKGPIIARIVVFAVLATLLELAFFFPDTLSHYIDVAIQSVKDLMTTFRHMRG